MSMYSLLINFGQDAPLVLRFLRLSSYRLSTMELEHKESSSERLMNTEPQVYFAYMVRVWRVNQPPSAGVLAGWRASLECPQTGKQIGFGSLQELFTFLSEEVMRCEATDAHKHQATG